MEKRKGFLSLLLLVALSSMLTLAGGFLFYLSHSASGSIVYGNGLRAVYAAESGANWGLASLEKGNITERTVTFSYDETDCLVKIANLVKNGNGLTGRILSRGTDKKSHMVRYVQIDFIVTEGEKRKISVENVGSGKWI